MSIGLKYKREDVAPIIINLVELVRGGKCSIPVGFCLYKPWQWYMCVMFGNKWFVSKLIIINA